MKNKNLLSLTEEEQQWIQNLRELAKAAPTTLKGKISSYTTGDNDITLYINQLNEQYRDADKDICVQVEEQNLEIIRIDFPFTIESTSG